MQEGLRTRAEDSKIREIVDKRVVKMNGLVFLEIQGFLVNAAVVFSEREGEV